MMGKRHFQSRFVRRRCSARRNFEEIVGSSSRSQPYPTNPIHLHSNTGEEVLASPRRNNGNSRIEAPGRLHRNNSSDFALSEAENSDCFIQADGSNEYSVIGQQELNQEDTAFNRSDQGSGRNISESSGQLLKGHILAALLPLIGTSRMTIRQFELLRSYSNFYARGGSMKRIPSYSYLLRHFYPLLRSRLFVPMTLAQAVVNTARAGAPQPLLLLSSDSGARTVPVLYVKLSAWAVRDVKLSDGINARLRENLENANLRRNALEDIENADVVHRRDLHVKSTSLRFLYRTSPSQTSVTSFIREGSCVKIFVAVQARENAKSLESRGFQLHFQRNTYALRAKLGETELCFNNSVESFRTADLVTVVTPLSSSDIEEFRPEKLYLVYRMIRRGREPAVFITSTEPGSPLNGSQIRCISLQEDNPTTTNTTEEHSGASSSRSSGLNFGTLEDGRKYVIYRVLLYADDFEQSAGKKGSAGGLYMTPLTLPLPERTSSKSVRVLSLSPPGVSTQEMFSHLIPDIVKSSTEGVECVDRFGERVTAFTDLVGFVCDYHEANHACYVRGSTALAPCNLCTFSKGSANSISSSDYAYTTAIHSGHPSFRRDYERMKALLSYSKSDGHLQKYGLKSGTDFDENPPPFHKLHQELEKARLNVPRTITGEPVVPAQFDPYLSVLVAPDHLLTGLFEDLINLNFRVLAPLKRLHAEAMMTDVLRRNGMHTEGHIYNHDSLSLHGMKMSSLYSLLVVSPWAFLSASHADTNGKVQPQQLRPPSEHVSLLFNFQRLVSKTLFFSRPALDGLEPIPHGMCDRRNAYFKDLQDLAARYVQKVDSLCSKCSHAKKILDKPNMHRLMELYHHSIPAMGHVRHFQELMFEAAHQPLKRALRQSNNRDAQLSAMYAVAGNEWKCRLASAVSGASLPEQITESQSRTIRFLLCGDHHSGESADVNLARIRDCMWEPVIAHLSSFTADSEPDSERRYIWVSVRSSQMEQASDLETLSPLLQSCNALLKSIYSSQLLSGGKLLTVHMAEKVLFYPTLEPTIHKAFSNPSVRRIEAGDIVQSMVHRSWCFNRATSGLSNEHCGIPTILCDITSPSYGHANSRDFRKTSWQILQLVQFLPRNARCSTDAKLYAYVHPVLQDELRGLHIGDCCIKIHRAQVDKGVFVLPLNEPVVKLLSLHSCWTGQRPCLIDKITKSVQHSNEDKDNHFFLVYDRSSGFPPRSA